MRPNINVIYRREMDAMRRAQALAEHLSIGADDVTDIGDHEFEADGGEWLVLTPEEADARFDDYQESYIDECVLPKIPEAYRCYFDWDAYKRDVRISDGRGPSLAGYDSEERQVFTGDGDYFLVYRTN